MLHCALSTPWGHAGPVSLHSLSFLSFLRDWQSPCETSDLFPRATDIFNNFKCPSCLLPTHKHLEDGSKDPSAGNALLSSLAFPFVSVLLFPSVHTWLTSPASGWASQPLIKPVSSLLTCLWCFPDLSLLHSEFCEHTPVLVVPGNWQKR